MYNLKTLRQLLFCSQSELGVLLGRSHLTIGHVESGRRQMPIGKNEKYYELDGLFSKWTRAKVLGNYTPDEDQRQWLQDEEQRIREELQFQYEADRALWSKAIKELEAMMKRYWLAFDGAELSSSLVQEVKKGGTISETWFIVSRSRAREAMLRDGPLAQKSLILKIEGLETQLNKTAEWMGKDTSDMDFMRSAYQKLTTAGVKAGAFKHLDRRI